MRANDIDAALKRAARDPDGSYRVIASKRIEGRPLGGFRFSGTRSDDPNDYIPHEHRRELRGYGTFAAWVNHVDSKSINTFDALVSEGNTRSSGTTCWTSGRRWERRCVPTRAIRGSGVSG